MTIIHHAGKGGVQPEDGGAGRVHAAPVRAKHFTAPRRAAYLAAVGSKHLVRAAAPGGGEAGTRRRVAARLALRTLAGRADAPFGPPPTTAFSERSRVGSTTPAR